MFGFIKPNHVLFCLPIQFAFDSSPILVSYFRLSLYTPSAFGKTIGRVLNILDPHADARCVPLLIKLEKAVDGFYKFCSVLFAYYFLSTLEMF